MTFPCFGERATGTRNAKEISTMPHRRDAASIEMEIHYCIRSWLQHQNGGKYARRSTIKPFKSDPPGISSDLGRYCSCRSPCCVHSGAREHCRGGCLGRG